MEEETRMSWIRKVADKIVSTAKDFVKPYVEIGKLTRDLVVDVAEHYGLKELNSDYKRLPRNTPLYINCEPYVVKRSQEDGERDLVALANEVPHEGSWFFTPVDSHWYHITESHEETQSPDGKFRFSDISRKGFFKVRGEELIHYHIHPKRAAELETDQFVKMLEKRQGTSNEQGETQDFEKGLFAGLFTAYAHCLICFPSLADVSLYADLTKKLEDNVQFEGKIASPMGITSTEIVDPSEDTKKLYREIHKGRYDRIAESGAEVKQDGNQIKIYTGQKRLLRKASEDMDGKMKLEFQVVD